MRRNARKILKGLVISNKMQKTAIVAVDLYKKDPLYGKKVKKTHKFYIHDEKEITKIGDLVNFMETRPLSKTKRFRLLNIIKNTQKKNNKEEENR
jgi:small subunit ribosomal protein S17